MDDQPTATPVVRAPDQAVARDLAPGVTAAELLGDAHGCRGLQQRRLTFAPGARVAGTAGGLGESWYVVSGSVCVVPGTTLDRDMVAWLRRGSSYAVSAAEPAEVVVTTVRAGSPGDDSGPGVRVVSLADCEVERTGDREFRVLLSAGLAVTQFAGMIPPGRAPAHHHSYDEVVHVLSGHGVVHLADRDAAIGPGTAIYLPPRHEHCLENTGTEVLRVLGMFHPAGSPAAKG